MAFFQRTAEFLDTKAGLVILGFLVTTVGGSILNVQIQERAARNQYAFELAKERFKEARQLQADLLQSSNARAFTLSQVIGQLAHPADYPFKEVKAYWDDKVEPPKVEWNLKRYQFHAQARALYSPALADLIYRAEEDPTEVQDEDPEARDPAQYDARKPRSLHGALVDLNRTAYRMLRKCQAQPACDTARLQRLANRQVAHLELLQRCVLYRMSHELLHRSGPGVAAAGDDGAVPAQCNALPG